MLSQINEPTPRSAEKDKPPRPISMPKGWTLDQRAWIFIGVVGAIVAGATEYTPMVAVWGGLCAVLFYLAGIYHRLGRD